MSCNRLNVRKSSLCPQDTQSEETYECLSCSVYRILESLSLFFLSIFRSPLHGDFLLLYSILKLIRALHLSEEERRDFDTHRIIYWRFSLHPCGGVLPRASLMLKAFNDSGGVNCCVWRFTLF